MRYRAQTQINRFYGAVWLVILALFIWPSLGVCGAWPQDIGKTQLISSFESAEAVSRFEVSGHGLLPLSHWRAKSTTIYAEHGLTNRLTLTGKLNFQDYQDPVDHFSGLGSVELGARYSFKPAKNTAFALGISVEGLGKGRHDEFNLGTKTSGTDFELRGYFGKSFQLKNISAFVDIQLARRLRQFDQHQWRLDLTLGLKPARQWLVMTQIFAGVTDKSASQQSRWVNRQVSVVRYLKPDERLGVQLALRDTLSGANVPRVRAISLGLWQKF